MDFIDVFKADYNKKDDVWAIKFLLNSYAQELEGFKKEIDEDVLDNLTLGLENFPGSIVLLAKKDGEYAGMGICFLGFSTFQAKKLLNIHDFMVLKKFQGIGVAKKLMNEIILTAGALSCCKITLEVQEKNLKARNLYSSFGFKDSFLDPEAGVQLFLTRGL